MAKISIIIPCYNQEKYISECLDSVIAQTFQDWEAIVIDDGSTDNSLNIIQEYHKKYPEKIRILSQKNQGVVTARNKAIEQAAGEYIFPLDGDDLITPDCLEKLWQAMESKKGDIITFRVKYFGKRTEEMLLPLPNKRYMCKDNCLVNAALFRKKDFLKTGGYDPAFNIALEDYDLWCNFLYRHNKKIYRIPEILFFYRLKDETESRNFQHKSEHKNLVKLLYKKYPRMHLYKKLSFAITYPKFIKKIPSFLFRKENNNIKICKIKIKKIKHYDTVMSIGAACFVPEVLKTENLRDFSGPFDWMYGGGIEKRLEILKHRFQNYFNYEDFEFVKKNQENGKFIYKNKRSEIVYNHDFTSDKLDETFPEISQKYKRRTDRVLKLLDDEQKILLVYAGLALIGDKQKVINLIEEINKIYKADIDLLFINNNPQMSLGKYKKLKNISPHIFYSVYRYQVFPDEMKNAKQILTNHLREILK